MKRKPSGPFRLVRPTDRYSVNAVRIPGGIGYVIFDRLALSDDSMPTTYADWTFAHSVADDLNSKHRANAA